MLAFVAGCEKFDQYIYGHVIHVETDHKCLVSITRKPIHLAPKYLQRMLLKLHKYVFNLEYKKEKEMYLADTLSRAYPKDSAPQTEPQSEFCHHLEEVSLSQSQMNWHNNFMMRLQSTQVYKF